MFRLFGFYCLFSPILSLVSWIPFIGSLIASGISFVLWIIAFILAVLFWVITVALAWIYYRPLYAILGITAIGLIVGLIMFTPRH